MDKEEFNEKHNVQLVSKCCSHCKHIGRTYSCAFCIHPDRDLPTVVLLDQVCDCFE